MSIEQEFLREKRRHNLQETISLKEKYLLKKKVPFQKILGFIDFDDLKIQIDKKVLIPRYETQEVVNFALKNIKPNAKVLDLCAGSGYIGLTIKKEKNSEVTLSDISTSCIKQIKVNASLNNLKVKIIKSNLFSRIKEKFDVIVSNPPYIPLSEKKNLDKSVIKYDPHLALFGGEDGNYFYKKIIEKVSSFLKPQGILIFEISPYNEAFLKMNNFNIYNDINKKPRIAFKRY